MKAEVDRGVVGAERELMLKSDKLEFERGAAAKTENQDRYNGKENRHHDRDGTAGSGKSPASLGPVEILSKDSGAITSVRLHHRPFDQVVAFAETISRRLG
jgi:hypothetical protein